jgi:hypothetical protein
MPTKRIPRHFVAPELIQQGEKLPWQTSESAMLEAAVNLEGRTARVPGISTEEEALTRRHELGHVAWSPLDWLEALSNAAKTHHLPPNSVSIDTMDRIGKMLEEVRIDAKLWFEQEVDMRTVRETADWTKIPLPKDKLGATEVLLQLGWTVWGSQGSPRVAGMAPRRDVDPATNEYMQKVWDKLYSEDPVFAQMVFRCYEEMAKNPTPETRDELLVQLAQKFPKTETPDKPMPMKESAKKKIEEARKEEKEAEERTEQRKRADEAPPTSTKEGHYDIHDHTASIKRPSMKIRRKEAPVGYGNKLTFAHRWMMDKSVFARRTLTEGGIMIDGSGSMHWTDDDLQEILAKLPAVWVGIYSGFYAPGTGILGRICILAKKGRWSTYITERGKGGGNEIDLEALQLLARWPKPRIWLSDGEVCGGKYDLSDSTETGAWMQQHGPLIRACTKVMKRNEIIRVSTKEDLAKLVSGQRITGYRSPIGYGDYIKNRGAFYTPADMKDVFGNTPEEPVKFKL